MSETPPPGPGGPPTDPIVTSEGFFAYTDATRDSITGLNSSHVIYNKTSQQLQYKTGSGWQEVAIPDGIVKKLMRQLFQETAGVQLNIIEKLIEE